MAKKAMIEREKKRARLVEKYAAKRAELKEIANDELLLPQMLVTSHRLLVLFLT